MPDNIPAQKTEATIYAVAGNLSVIFKNGIARRLNDDSKKSAKENLLIRRIFLFVTLSPFYLENSSYLVFRLCFVLKRIIATKIHSTTITINMIVINRKINV